MHTINIKVKPEFSILQVLTYIAQLARVPTNFINIYYKQKKLSNSEVLFRCGIADGA